MKKLLSLVLVLAMVLGLSVPAFAESLETLNSVSITADTEYTDIEAGFSVEVTGDAQYTAEYDGIEFILEDAVYYWYAGGSQWYTVDAGEEKAITDSDECPDVTDAKEVFARFKLYPDFENAGAFALSSTVECNQQALSKIAISTYEDGWFGEKFNDTDTTYSSIVIRVDVTPSKKTSGTTNITATKAAPFTYDIVIPESVTGITAAGVYEVGQAKVENVVSATDKTVISYTATTTDFKCEGVDDLPAAYYTEEAATNAFPTAVIAYENKADAASIPTMWVKIDESDWESAAVGTYTATVTYNFESWEAFGTIQEIMDTVSDFPTGFEDFKANEYWLNEKASYLLNLDMENEETPEDKLFFMDQDEDCLSVSYDTDVTRTGFNYTYTDEESDATVTFNMKNHVLESITISGITGEGLEDFLNGTYYNTVLFSSVINENDLPQGESSAWVNEYGAKFYKDSDAGYTAEYNSSVSACFEITDTKKVRKIDGNYSLAVQEGTAYSTFTFNMKDGTVESVTVFHSGEGADNLNGTYAAPTVE